MIGSTVAILTAVLIQLALGGTVFLANRQRKSNQAFLLLSLAATAWLGSLYYILTATQLRAAEVGIREASVAGILFLVMCIWLGLWLGWHQTGGAFLVHLRFGLIYTVVHIVLHQLRFFLL